MAQAKKNSVQAATQSPTTAQALGSLLKSARDIMRKDKGLNGDLDRLPMLTWIMFLKFLDDLEQQREQDAKLAGKKFRPAIEPTYRWRDWAANPQGVTGDELLTFMNQDECMRPDGTRGAGLFAYLRGLSSSNGDDRRDVIARVFDGVDNRMRSGYLLRDVINKVAGIHFTSSEELHTLGALYESLLREMRDAAGDSGEFYTPRAVVRFMVAVTDPRLGEVVLDPACGTGGFLVEAFSHLAKHVTTVADRKILQERSVLGCEAKPLPYLLGQMNLLLHGLDSPQIDPGNALRNKLTEIGEKDRVDVILTNPPFGGEEERGVQANFPEDKQTAETALLFLQLIMRKLRRQPKAGYPPSRAAVVVPESVMSDSGVAQRVRKELCESFALHTIVRLPKGVFEPYSDIQTNLLFFDTSRPGDGTWFYQHPVPPERRTMKTPCYTTTVPLKFDELVPLIQWWTDRRESALAYFVTRDTIRERGYTLDFRHPARLESDPERRLDDAVLSLDAALAHARTITAALRDTLATLHSTDARVAPMRLGMFLKRDKREAQVSQEQSYDQVTVKLHGKGVVLRSRALGASIKTRPQFLARTGQLIMSKIDARNGAFGIVPEELDGALVTNDFPVFEIDTDLVRPQYLSLLLSSDAFVDACKRASRGTTNRKRLREELFLAECLPIAGIPLQDLTIKAVRELEELALNLGPTPEAVRALFSGLADMLLGWGNESQ